MRLDPRPNPMPHEAPPNVIAVERRAGHVAPAIRAARRLDDVKLDLAFACLAALGLGLVVAGAVMVYPPAGLIVGGAGLVTIAARAARGL